MSLLLVTPNAMTRQFPLQIHISAIFLALLLLVGAILGSIGYGLARQILTSTAQDLTHAFIAKP